METTTVKQKAKRNRRFFRESFKMKMLELIDTGQLDIHHVRDAAGVPIPKSVVERWRPALLGQSRPPKKTIILPDKKATVTFERRDPIRNAFMQDILNRLDKLEAVVEIMKQDYLTRDLPDPVAYSRV